MTVEERQANDYRHLGGAEEMEHWNWSLEALGSNVTNSCVTLCKSINLSEPVFSSVKWGGRT